MTFGFDVYLGRYGVATTIHEYTTESVRINRPGNTSVALHVFLSHFSHQDGLNSLPVTGYLMVRLGSDAWRKRPWGERCFFVCFLQNLEERCILKFGASSNWELGRFFSPCTSFLLLRTLRVQTTCRRA